MRQEEDALLEQLSLFLGAILIIFLQLGFSMLQIGGVQHRRSRKMLIKSVFDMSITGLGTLESGNPHFDIIGWWLVGYGIAYGHDQNQFAGSSKVDSPRFSSHHRSIVSNIQVVRCGFYHGVCALFHFLLFRVVWLKELDLGLMLLMPLFMSSLSFHL